MQGQRYVVSKWHLMGWLIKYIFHMTLNNVVNAL